MKSTKATKRAPTQKSEDATKSESTRKSEEPAVRVLKTATCPSLSGKSTITYEVGRDERSEVQLRVTANTNAGAFVHDWVGLRAALAALGRAPEGETVTSALLVPLFRKRSLGSRKGRLVPDGQFRSNRMHSRFQK